MKKLIITLGEMDMIEVQNTILILKSLCNGKYLGYNESSDIVEFEIKDINIDIYLNTGLKAFLEMLKGRNMITKTDIK